MIFESFAPFAPCEFQIKFAIEAWEKKAAAALRRKVFCEEQGLFDCDDRDAIDLHAVTLVAVSFVGVAADEVVGTVRIHQAEPGVWWGSRLAVSADCRRVGALGAGLIRLAVSAAHAQGCVRFLAHVQAQNVSMFGKLHWRTLDHRVLHDRPHHLMEADLAFYPPFAAPEIGFVALRKAA
jgi:putative N-acetyltransferase (TIGR04045 family)